MEEKDLQKVFYRQKILDNKLSKVQLFKEPSKKVSIEDVLILEKLIYSFIKTFKNNPNCFAETIQSSDLYKYNENIDWYNNYIIDLNQNLTHEVFNCNNALYKYTPRIYKYNNVFYIEKTFGNLLDINNKDHVEHLLYALKEMFKVGIAINNSFSSVSIEKNIVKFKEFFPVGDSDKRDIESVYKNSLLEKCSDEEIKAFIQDFHLEVSQNGVN